jgi:hypothetical protein
MYEDLEAIARLEYGKAVERLSRQALEKLQRIQTMPRGGQAEYARLNVEIEQCEESCRTYAQIWQDLLEARNGGHLTRENVNFIIEKVQHLVAARKSNLMGRPNPSRLPSSSNEITTRMDGVAASLRRDLEIRIRKQMAFPKKDVMPTPPNINVTIHNAANVNLGTQMGTINATLNAISDQSQAHSEVAAALRQLSEAVLSNSQIQSPQKKEALEVITDIAKQAEAKPEARSIGPLKAMIAGLPTIIGLAADLTALWEKFAPTIKHFFNI